MSTLTFEKSGRYWESSVMRGAVCAVQIEFKPNDCADNKIIILTSLDGNMYTAGDSDLTSQPKYYKLLSDTYDGMYLRIRTYKQPISAAYLVKTSESGSGSGGGSGSSTDTTSASYISSSETIEFT